MTAESLGIKLLTQGYMQAYIDFFYLTNENTPSKIKPNPSLLKEYQLKKRVKGKF